VKGIHTQATSRLIAIGLGVASVSYASIAFAAEGAAEGATAEAAQSGVSKLLPPLGEFIPVLIAFLVLFAIMWKFALPAVVESLDKRAETIRTGLERAEAARIEAERLLEEYRQTMADARKEAGAILQQAKQAAEATRSEAAVKAAAEYDEILNKAKDAIEGEKRAAIAALQASVADISVSVAGKIIGSELSKEDHLNVIEKYISEAGSLNAN
jgi:F-type H+-transporting ATPase subunit b